MKNKKKNRVTKSKVVIIRNKRLCKMNSNNYILNYYSSDGYVFDIENTKKLAKECEEELEIARKERRKNKRNMISKKRRDLILG